MQQHQVGTGHEQRPVGVPRHGHRRHRGAHQVEGRLGRRPPEAEREAERLEEALRLGEAGLVLRLDREAGEGVAQDLAPLRRVDPPLPDEAGRVGAVVGHRPLEPVDQDHLDLPAELGGVGADQAGQHRVGGKARHQPAGDPFQRVDPAQPFEQPGLGRGGGAGHQRAS